MTCNPFKGGSGEEMVNVACYTLSPGCHFHVGHKVHPRLQSQACGDPEQIRIEKCWIQDLWLVQWALWMWFHVVPDLLREPEAHKRGREQQPWLL